MSKGAMTPQEIRVERAAIAVAAYRKNAGWGDDEEIIADLLADLMHYVRALRLDREIGVSFGALLYRAEYNYTAEIEDLE